jgi:Phosphodiester glycosidase
MWVLIVIVVLLLTFTFIHENCDGDDHMACFGGANSSDTNTATTDIRIDGNATRTTMIIRTQREQEQRQQQVKQHQHEESDDNDNDDGLLVLLPVSAYPETTTSIEILPNLPRNGFLVRTMQEFFIVLPDDVSPFPQKPPLLFAMLPPDLKADARGRIVRRNGYYGRRLEQTSTLAKRHNCTIAANAGPFNKDGSCVGTIVVNGQIIQLEKCNSSTMNNHNNNNNNNNSSTSSSVGFGITAGPVRSWVLGSLPCSNQQADYIHKLGLVHFVTGFDWLVQDGVNVANKSGRNNTTGAQRAPRTSIGIDNQGRLVILVIDGCELWYVMLWSLFDDAH